ncbi:MAG: hypothetical protein WKG07_39445 [Hymenobacter sp.]
MFIAVLGPIATDDLLRPAEQDGRATQPAGPAHRWLAISSRNTLPAATACWR